jgi:putative peptidoglycan lipid II flippase
LFLERLEASWRRMAFFTLPTAVGYLAFGSFLVAALYGTGEFGRPETWLVYLVLAGYSLGIPATTTSRLLQNSFYALGDTRFPARVAAERMVISAAAALPLMLGFDRVSVSGVLGGGIGGSLFLGALGLSLASAVGAWWELLRLGRGLGRRVEGLRPPWRHLSTWLVLALAATLPALALAWRLPSLHPLLEGALVPGTFAAAYLVLTRLVGMSELRSWLGRG